VVEERPHVELGARGRSPQIVGMDPVDVPAGERSGSVDSLYRIHGSSFELGD
jgi:hypothetical protein